MGLSPGTAYEFDVSVTFITGTKSPFATIKANTGMNKVEFESRNPDFGNFKILATIGIFFNSFSIQVSNFGTHQITNY